MKKHLANAAYGFWDYASYPLGMLVVAPIVLHRLGAAEYGLWTISTAVVSTGGIIASGFCDANIQRVSKLRGSGDSESLVRTVRSMLGINLLLGIAIAGIAWIATPFAARQITAAHPEQLAECLAALRIGCVLILVRTMETVFVSTQRAFEHFRTSVQINTAVRWLTLGTAAILALCGGRTVSILAETALFLAAGTLLQFRQARRLLGFAPLWPRLQPEETRALLGFGVFSWIQSLGGVIFSHLDRVIVGVTLGAVAVAPYTLCVQFAHPIFAGTASGLQFLFPYLSSRVGVLTPAELRQTLLKVFLCNVLLIAAGASLLMIFGDRLIQAWAGVAVAQSAAKILPPIVLGASLMGVSVTGTYALLAHGMFRTLAVINLSTRGAMLLIMTWLVRHDGLHGLALSRVLLGVLALLVYLPLLRRFESGSKAHAEPASFGVCELQEAPKA